MPKLPTTLLRDVMWCFALDAPQSREEMIEDVCFFARFMDAQDPKSELLRRLPFADVRLRYEYGVPPRGPRYGEDDEDEDWQPKVAEGRIAAGPMAVLTVADLLWELHLAFAETIGECQEHFLEGLELESASTGEEPPRYRVLLGC